MRSFWIGKAAIVLLVISLLCMPLLGCSRYGTVDSDDEEGSDKKTHTGSSLFSKPEKTPADESGQDQDVDMEEDTDQNAETTAEPTPSVENHNDETDQANHGEYLLPESNLRRYEYMELYEYFPDPAQAAYARNEIFARHGHIFDNEVYTKYFSAQPWYVAKGKVDFDALNDNEKYNAKLLLFFEKGYQGKVPEGAERGEDPVNPSWLVYELKAGETYQCDMDGDGTKETVSWSQNTEAEGVIKINKLSARVAEFGNWAEYAAIVDLDPGDPYKEIVICDEGPSSDEWSYLYSYQSKKINKMGEAAGYYKYGSIKPDGKGGVIASTRAGLLHTWFYNKSYKLDKSHKLVAVPVAFYVTAYPVFLRNPVQLSPQRDNKNVFTVKDGQAALLSATDDQAWCRLTLEDGTEGWFEVNGFSTLVREDVYAGNVFDNLCNAD